MAFFTFGKWLPLSSNSLYFPSFHLLIQGRHWSWSQSQLSHTKIDSCNSNLPLDLWCIYAVQLTLKWTLLPFIFRGQKSSSLCLILLKCLISVIIYPSILSNIMSIMSSLITCGHKEWEQIKWKIYQEKDSSLCDREQGWSSLTQWLTMLLIFNLPKETTEEFLFKILRKYTRDS